MVCLSISLMISRTFSKFSSVPPEEGQPEGLQPITEYKHSKFCVLPMALSLKAAMNISGVFNAVFPRQKKIVMQMLCSLISKSGVALNTRVSKHTLSNKAEQTVVPAKFTRLA